MTHFVLATLSLNYQNKKIPLNYNVCFNILIMNDINKAQDKLTDIFKQVDEIRDFNQEKVLTAFVDNKIGEEHFAYVSGYGHDDLGRDAIDKVYAQVFKAEKAIVRVQFASGTHTLACVLFGILRHGDKLVSVLGRPYDTMEEVIGERGDIKSSLKGHGVFYEQVELKDELYPDYEAIKNTIDKDTTMVLIQRSRGYNVRKSADIETIKKIVETVKSQNPECICFVDNCYGEFSEKAEPLEVGADIMAGSLIKNPGGGITECGGYIAGKKDLVDLAANRLTAPGIGSEGGTMLNQTRLMLQGFFMSPSVVSDAIKGAILAAQVFKDMGLKTDPLPSQLRTDIIQIIEFNCPEKLQKFCKVLQANSPVNSYLTPIPDEVPGYDDKLIMAGGSFIEGSTIELSADGPMREPYVAYMQGALNYAHVKIALKNVVEELKKL